MVKQEASTFEFLVRVWVLLYMCEFRTKFFNLTVKCIFDKNEIQVRFLEELKGKQVSAVKLPTILKKRIDWVV